MNVKSVEKQEHSAVELAIEVSREEFEIAIEKIYRKQKGSIAVPGFRKGKAPRKVIEGMYGSNIFYEDAINDVYPTAYSQAVEQEKLDVVSYPSVEITNVDRDGFSFKATVTVRPLAKIKDYKGLAAFKDEVKLTDEDIDTELKPFVERAIRIVSVERPAKNGDTAVIDYEGFESGVPFEGGKGEKHELELGSNSFIPGFEEKVVGMSAGEEKDIELSFPEDYHAKDLAGKHVVFHVKLHEVKERIAPVLDDEFAKDVSEFDSLDELKKDLAEKLTQTRQSEMEKAFDESLLEQLVALMEVEIPDPMVDYSVDKMVDDYAARISSQGIPFEQYLQMLGMTREDMRVQAREGALHQIQGRLALEAVAAAEELEASDEEMEAELAKLAEQYSMEIEQIRKIIPLDDLKGDLLRQKAMKVVTESAKVDKKKKPAKIDAEKTESGAEKPAKKSVTKVASDAAEAPVAEKPKRKAAVKKAGKSKSEE